MVQIILETTLLDDLVLLYDYIEDLFTFYKRDDEQVLAMVVFVMKEKKKEQKHHLLLLLRLLFLLTRTAYHSIIMHIVVGDGHAVP